MSEARTPDEETINTGDESEAPRDERETLRPTDDYSGPDPVDDPKGDRSDEDQGT